MSLPTIRFMFLFLIISSLVACRVSIKNNFVKKHPKEVETFTNDFIHAVYNDDKKFVLDNYDKNVDGFKPEAIDFIFKLASDLDELDFAKVDSRSLNIINSQKHYITVFHVPRKNGRDVIEVVVKFKDKQCCIVNSTKLSLKIGETYIMEKS